MGGSSDRYEVLNILGSGTTARVFLVRDKLLGRKAAAKVGQEKALLLQEARYLAMSANPFFPALYDCWEEGPNCVLLMEYIEGETLKQRLDRIGRYTEDEVLRIACMTAEAVDGLHRAALPCVYGDIKPDNIMMQRDGRIRLVDFGAVCPLAQEEKDGEERAVKRGGTPFYAPPDMWEGKADIRNDIYSLGRLMQELLGTEQGRRVSYLTERVIDRCILLQKEKRYQSMGEFIREALNVCKGVSS